MLSLLARVNYIPLTSPLGAKRREQREQVGETYSSGEVQTRGEWPISIMISVKVGNGTEEDGANAHAGPCDALIRNINAPSDAVASAVNQEKATREPSDIYLGIELGEINIRACFTLIYCKNNEIA